MQINAKWSFKYALASLSALLPQVVGGHYLFFFSEPQTMSPPSGYSPHTGRPYSSAFWRQAPACLMGLGWETKSWRSLKWGSHWHNQCAWTFETLEFIPIRAGERQYRRARAKGSASYWLQPKKDELFVSLRIWREKKKVSSLIAFSQCRAQWRDVFREGHMVWREKSMIGASHSSMCALTRAHLKRLGYRCHTI